MNDGFGGFVTGMALGLLIGIMGCSMDKKEWQSEAVKAGVAEFYIADPVTGAPEFRWKTNLPERAK